MIEINSSIPCWFNFYLKTRLFLQNQTYLEAPIAIATRFFTLLFKIDSHVWVKRVLSYIFSHVMSTDFIYLQVLFTTQQCRWKCQKHSFKHLTNMHPFLKNIFWNHNKALFNYIAQLYLTAYLVYRDRHVSLQMFS